MKDEYPAERCAKRALDLTVLGMKSAPAFGRVDCALVRYRRETPEEPLRMAFLLYDEIPVSLRSRTPILNLLRDHSKNPQTILRVHSMLGHMFFTAVKRLCKNHNITPASLDLIGAHTATFPSLVTLTSAGLETMMQATSPQSWGAIIAEGTGITTATHHRTTMRPLNGHAPPPAASLDMLLLQHPTKCRVCITISDYANITIVPPAELSGANAILNTICGPGTMFIDYAMRYTTSNQLEHDQDGRYAARGTVNNSVVDRFLETHDYTNRAPPLSIAIEMFGQHDAQGLIDECLFLGMSDYDTIATITRLTAENIARQYRRLISGSIPPNLSIDEIFICGPGARNTAIVDHLEDVLPEDVITRPLDDIGIPGDAKDAVCSAQLGLQAVLALATTDLERKESTSTPGHTESGTVVRGKQWDVILDQVQGFGEGKPLPSMERILVDPNLGWREDFCGGNL